MDRYSPSSRDKPHDLVSGQRIAAPCVPNHHIVNSLDEQGIFGAPCDLLDEAFQTPFFLFFLLFQPFLRKDFPMIWLAVTFP